MQFSVSGKKLLFRLVAVVFLLFLAPDPISADPSVTIITDLPAAPTAIAVQPDGKILAAYWAEGPRLVRLDADGSLDPNFVTQAVPFENTCCAYIHQIGIARDSKIYIAGTFISTNGFGLNQIARLNSDGSLDSTFQPQLQASLQPPQPLFFALQPDDKILVAQVWDQQRFRHQQGPTRNQPLRLTTTGALDRTFDIGTTQLTITDMLVHPDGNTYVTGAPRNGSTRGLYRLTSRGQLDNTFSASADGLPYALHLDKDEHLIVGGAFTRIKNITTPLARLRLSDGTVEPASIGTVDGRIERIALSDDGGIYLSGSFNSIHSQERPGLARLNPDLSLDATWNPSFTFTKTAFSYRPLLALQSDGPLLVGLSGTINGQSATGLVRIAQTAIEPPQNLPPIVHILSPTNGAIYRVSDAVPPFEISVTASDPEGLSLETKLYLDTELLTSNPSTNFSFPTLLPASGDHELVAVTTDPQGLASTNRISFTVEPLPQPTTLQITTSGNRFLITFSGQLQSSSDLIHWFDLASTSPHEEPISQNQRFFRSR